MPICSSVKRPSSEVSSTASRAGISLDEAVEAFEASGAKRLLVTHRPRELPAPDRFELAYDGLELEV